MFNYQRHFRLLLVLVGSLIFASMAVAQDVYETVKYSPATVTLAADRTRIDSCGNEPAVVQLKATATSPSGNPIRYTWRTSNGHIVGDGPAVAWNLAGVSPGLYKAYLTVNTGNGNDLCEAATETVVEVRCAPKANVVCPSVRIACPEQIEVGKPITFTSTLNGGSGSVPAIYHWTISGGKIISGQGTNSITVDTTGMEGQALKASLSMAGYENECLGSCIIQFPPKITSRKFDEFPDIARNDEKARLDNLAIALQNDPTATGYIVVHPGRHYRPGETQKRANRISDYLVTSRGIDMRRLVTVTGSPRDEFMVELWIRPQGATLPSY